MTTTSDQELARGLNWSARFDFGTVPVRRDAAVLYEHDFGLDVREKGLGITTQPGYRSRLRQQLARVLDKRVPDTRFEGVICLDIEFLHPWWEGDREVTPEFRRGMDQFELWRFHLQANDPELIQHRNLHSRNEIFRRTYEGAVRAWYGMIVDECRSLRPYAKFGFYGIPAGSRHDRDYAKPEGQPHRDANDKVRWMIDISDCILLPLYQDKVILRDLERQVTPREIPLELGRAFIETNIAEAKRLAGRKPVYVIAMMTYPDWIKDCLPALAERPMNDDNLAALFVWPKEFGADGIVIWDHFESATKFRLLQSEYSGRIESALKRIVDR